LLVLDAWRHSGLPAGDLGLVAVRLTDTGASVFVYGMRWDGPHTPVLVYRPLAELSRADFRGNEAEAVIAAEQLVHAAVVVRRAGTRRCRYCGQTRRRSGRTGKIGAKPVRSGNSASWIESEARTVQCSGIAAGGASL
jgi:hypothetical protein